MWSNNYNSPFDGNQSMNSNKRALPLIVALCVLTLSSAFGADDRPSQPQTSGNPPVASAQASADQSQPTQKLPRPKKALVQVPTEVRGAKTVASDAASVSKAPETKSGKAPATSAGSGTFVQSALNSVGELVRSDEVPKGTPSNGSTSVLAARMSEDLAKSATVKPGTIDEQVHEDGRREERVHTLGGAEYCVTFESPSDPKDGIDKMQYGLHPAGMSNGASMHTCGHRFDGTVSNGLLPQASP